MYVPVLMHVHILTYVCVMFVVCTINTTFSEMNFKGKRNVATGELYDDLHDKVRLHIKTTTMCYVP